MKKPIGDLLKEKYPNTFSIGWVLIIGTGLLAVPKLNVVIFNERITNVILQIFTYGGLVSLALILLIFLVETLIIALPKFRKIFENIISLLLFVPKIVFTGYVWLVKALIRQAFIELLKEKSNLIGENITLRKQVNDDDFWSRILKLEELKNISFIIKPSEQTSYWRLGFKFSQTGIFSSTRYGPGYPLFHLTKDADERRLKITYYGEVGTSSLYEVIIDNYNNQSVRLVMVKTENSLKIEIFRENGKEVFSKEFPLEYHKYAQLAAWGDGRDFEIRLENILIRES